MRTATGRKTRILYLLLTLPILVIVTAVLACHPTQQKLTIKDVRPECPQDSIHILVGDAEEKGTYHVVSNLKLAGSHAKVPEFNDCQRFVIGGSSDYGPLVAIWAAERLDSLVDSLGELQRNSPGKKIALAAAEVYNYGSPYTALGIGHDFSCLYLWIDVLALKDASKAMPLGLKWEARMVPVGANEPDCTKPIDLSSISPGKLNVKVEQVPHLGDPDIPPVARWDWDSVHSQQYIGIKCGPFWCNVGTGDFITLGKQSAPLVWEEVPSTTLPPVAHMQGSERERVQGIKGWYDEQQLAVVGPGGPKLSGVRGRVYPHPALNRINDLTVFEREWIPTALVEVETEYNGKLHLALGQNRVYLCRGSSCHIPPGSSKCGPNDQDPNDRWWAMIVSGVDTTYHCVMRREHNMKIPGTVRWRWSENDEKIWARCTTGCCTVN